MRVSEFENQNLLNPGVYIFKLATVDAGQKTFNGDPLIKIRWEEEETGESVFDNLTVSQKAAFRLVPLWVALGGSREDEVTDVDEFANRLIHKLSNSARVGAVIRHETYEGKTRAKIAEYKDASAAEKLGPAQARGQGEKPPF